MNRPAFSFGASACVLMAGTAVAQCNPQWVLGSHIGYPGPASLHTLTYDFNRSAAVFFRYINSGTTHPSGIWGWRSPSDGTYGLGGSSQQP
jgi:hypothetical protein